MSNNIVAGIDLKRLDRIDTTIQKHVETSEIPGIVTVVQRRGELVHNKSLGVIGPGGERLQTDSIFRLNSMTKPIICVGLMMLYEQGLFQLSDPVSRFIPKFSELKVYDESIKTTVDSQREVKIHDLLTHTSGISYPWMEYGTVENIYRKNLFHHADISLTELIDDLLALPLAFHPGSRFRYGLSHDVIARLIEVISETSIDDFLKKFIFEPLGMTDTGYFVPLAKQNRFSALMGAIDPSERRRRPSQRSIPARKFKWISNPESDLEYRSHTAFRGGSGLVSTASDYLRFCSMLLNKGTLDDTRLLRRNTVQLITCNQLSPSLLPFEINGRFQHGYGYGIGVRVMINPNQYQKPSSVGEYGWSGAANTYFWIDPAEELIGIILAQIMPTGISSMADDFRILTYQAIVD